VKNKGRISKQAIETGLFFIIGLFESVCKRRVDLYDA